MAPSLDSVSLRFRDASTLGRPQATSSTLGAALPFSRTISPSRTDFRSQQQGGNNGNGYVHERQTPWKLGEIYRMRDIADPSRLIDVPSVRIYDGHYVVARRDSTEATEAYLRELDRAFADCLRVGEPLFRQTTGVDRPISSTGAGQMLIVLRNNTDNPERSRSSAE